MPGHEVVIVGAGVAGLTCGARLREQGLDVLALERESVAGGNVRTTSEGAFRLERGPHTFLGSADAIFETVERTGLTAELRQPRPEAKDRFIVRHGRLHAAPAGLWSFLTTGLLSARAKLTLATEPLRRERGQLDDTAATFFERRFGPEAARVLAGAFISGVYAGDPQALSAAAAFPLFWGFEQETGSMIRGAMRHGKRRKRQLAEKGLAPKKGLFSFQGGLGRYTEHLASGLGESCRVNAEVRGLRREGEGYRLHLSDEQTLEAKAVVIATPPASAASIVEGLDGDLAGLLSEIPMAPVAVVHLGFDRKLGEIPEGFGFLAPRDEGVRTLGVLFPSRLFSGRAPDKGDLLAGFVGGMLDRDALELPDEALTEIVLQDLKTLTGLAREPVFLRVQRYPAAIPQLIVGHLERIKNIEERLEEHPSLVLAGNYLLGVGMKDAAASGLRAADAILRATGR